MLDTCLRIRRRPESGAGEVVGAAGFLPDPAVDAFATALDRALRGDRPATDPVAGCIPYDDNTGVCPPQNEESPMLAERTFTVTHTGCGEETDELRVRVTTTERSGDMFPQCLTETDYEAGFQFPETLPGRVVVEHRSLNSLRPVARVAPLLS